jgi:hypothetical protein
MCGRVVFFPIRHFKLGDVLCLSCYDTIHAPPPLFPPLKPSIEFASTCPSQPSKMDNVPHNPAGEESNSVVECAFSNAPMVLKESAVILGGLASNGLVACGENMSHDCVLEHPADESATATIVSPRKRSKWDKVSRKPIAEMFSSAINIIAEHPAPSTVVLGDSSVASLSTIATNAESDSAPNEVTVAQEVLVEASGDGLVISGSLPPTELPPVNETALVEVSDFHDIGVNSIPYHAKSAPADNEDHLAISSATEPLDSANDAVDSSLPDFTIIGSLQELWPVVGVAKLKLLYCPKCNNSLAGGWKPSSYAWAVVLHCGQCCTHWIVCKSCPRINVHFVDVEDIKKHDKSKHSSGKMKASPAVRDSKKSITSPSMVASPMASNTIMTGAPDADSTANATISELFSSIIEGDSDKPPDMTFAPNAVSSANVTILPFSSAFVEDRSNGHRVKLVSVTNLDMLQKMFNAISAVPTASYQVIDRSLKQYRFYQDYARLFPDDEFCWNDLLTYFKNKALKEHRGHLDFDSIHATALITEGFMTTPQIPHIDYSWESCLLKDIRKNRSAGVSLRREFDGFHGTGNMPYTGHLPITPDGSFIYLWSGPGRASPYHIKFGTMLFIRGDVVHSGGCPTSPSQPYDATRLYNRLHFYIPNVPEDIPPNGIFCHNVDGSLFSKDYHYE